MIKIKDISNKKLNELFNKNKGILKTNQLKKAGLSDREIKKLLIQGKINKIKRGYYEINNNIYPEDVIIARLFPEAIIYLESALFHYKYIDRVPSETQIAVNKNNEKSKYKIDYPLIKVFYIEPKILQIGVDYYEKMGIKIKIFDRDKTICDVMRYRNKLDVEIFRKSIKSYINDQNKNLKNLELYSKKLNIQDKIDKYLGVWL
ncbi:type IV toxin-antitoxin system AbiEi family antitoxin domain-containing protein [Oceanotoga sp.]|uniref:type IV toxin-antitoxin system AbiEi family antitoxin domain-containing protein n=1 Tax=Oceanotoga sp. TaxID=2108366 RepID=UPI0028062F32|nr:type IV toxin-antitoxin system AbiEi family antitoxin domain-containing protein [Oceanotoga sp.]